MASTPETKGADMIARLICVSTTLAILAASFAPTALAAKKFFK